MNASIPKDAEIRGAIAAILASHSLDELTFERVYMLLEAKFVVPLSAKRDQIKQQLEILLFKVFVDYAASSSPGKTYPSPERAKERETLHKQPIKKLLQHRLSEINKKRSTELGSVVESVSSTSGDDCRYPPELVFKGSSFWVSTGLYPQVLHVRFACPVCLEKLALETTSIQRLRIECRRVPKGGGGGGAYGQEQRELGGGAGTRGREQGGAMEPVWNDESDVVAFEKVFEDPYRMPGDDDGDDDGGAGGGERFDSSSAPVQASEICVNFVFTQLLLITIVEGFRDFCTLRKVSLFGIKIDLFQ